MCICLSELFLKFIEWLGHLLQIASLTQERDALQKNCSQLAAVDKEKSQLQQKFDVSDMNSSLNTCNMMIQEASVKKFQL